MTGRQWLVPAATRGCGRPRPPPPPTSRGLVLAGTVLAAHRTKRCRGATARRRAWAIGRGRHRPRRCASGPRRWPPGRVPPLRAASYRCCAPAPVQQETLGASPSPDLSLPLPSRPGSGAVTVREALDAAGSNGAPARGAVNAAIGRRDGPAPAASAARAPSTDAAAPSAARPRLRRDRPR